MQIEQSLIDQAYTYEEYRQMVDNLLAEGKVTGPDQREDLVQYTKLNLQRMRRLDKTAVINQEAAERIHQISTPLTWLVITEGWCGDASQIVPVLAKMAALNSMIRFRLILRDEHTELMDSFLTNGGRAIPVLICIDEDGSVLSWWGPRPEEAMQIIKEMKAAGENQHQVIMEKVHGWYAQNKTAAIQHEIALQIDKCLLLAHK